MTKCGYIVQFNDTNHTTFRDWCITIGTVFKEQYLWGYVCCAIQKWPYI